MDLVLVFKALVLGLVEGLTEFLPVSSTGHLIVIEDLLHFRSDRREVFIIAIQAGAILAVCWEYRARLWRMMTGLTHAPLERRLAINVAIAFVPAAVAGVTFKQSIEELLFRPLSVAVALVIGGLIILWIERLHAGRDYHPPVGTVDDMTPLDALKIGLAQCFALIPGTSRSGATIIGGLIFGLSRPAAAQFSFFLAIPTVIGASVYSLYKAREQLHIGDLPIFAGGALAAFVAALVCVRWLLRYVSGHDFRPFAWYRIVFGGVILLTAYTGWVDWTE